VDEGKKTEDAADADDSRRMKSIVMSDQLYIHTA
jgi:hypothetical protein